MSQRTMPQIAHFGVFEVDLQSHELRKRGIKVKLQEQPFQVLGTLLEHPGEVVSREELRRRIWPSDTFVDFDNGLNGAVNRLREALGDSADSPRFVETVPRQGYRFIAALEDAAPVVGPGVLPKNGAGQAEAALPGKPANELPRVARARVLQPRVWGLTSLAVVGLALLALSLASRRHGAPGMTAPPKIRSIAVLPLENLSGDAGQEYFAEGMTDALITDLAQISSLKVISRTSVMQYKGTRKPLPEIAKELNVDGIVEGTVTRSGERVRVDAQLIEASTDRHFWARTYDYDLSDVIVLQNEVARAIANEIEAKVTPQEQARLLRREPVDPQAYELYLKGRYFWNKRTDASVRKSIDYFQQAIQRDPNYALAYAAVAEAYVIGGDLSPAESCSKARAAARTALQMDEGLAEAHTALAICLLRDWDWAGAEKEFQRAIALNPNYAWAHQCYGFGFLRTMGRLDAAAMEMKRAHELDPLSLIIAWHDGKHRTSKQLDDFMLENNLKKLELDPNFAHTHLVLGMVYTRKGMYQDAIAHLQKAIELTGGEPGPLSALGYTYAVLGRRNEALKVLQQLTLLSKRRYVSPYDIALIYVGLGEKDLAFDWLEKGVTDHDIPLASLRIEPEWASLRSGSRYSELIRRTGLPP
jgi:TolB-like protein/DNA-binding winged helix-turn-helix (wHTH) protein/tetratricopeptide (TPR) repeat protein